MPMNANSSQQSSPNLSSPNLQGRTAIVTGANIGLGFQTALQLAQQGIHVILACRSKDRAEAALKKLQAALPNGSFEIMLVDMGNMDSIRAFAEEFHRRLPSSTFSATTPGSSISRSAKAHRVSKRT